MEDRHFNFNQYSCPACKSNMNKATDERYHIVTCPNCGTNFRWTKSVLIPEPVKVVDHDTLVAERKGKEKGGDDGNYDE